MWLNATVTRDDAALTKLTCAHPPVGLNFQVPHTNGRPATAASATVVHTDGASLRVATTWSTGTPGPVLDVVRTASGSVVVCN